MIRRQCNNENMTTKEIIEILLTLVLAILGANWVIKKNVQKISQKQKSGNNSINIAISDTNNKEK